MADKIKFTDRTVNKTEPKLPEGKTDHIFFDADDRGFGLRVRDTGSKIWVYQYSRNNKTRRMTIGIWPTMSPSQAREQVRKLTAERRLGADPAHDLAMRQIDKETFADVVAQYLAAKEPELRDRTYAETQRYLTDSASKLNSRSMALEQQPHIREQVFGRGDSTDGFAGWSAAKAALDERLPGMPHWSLHDLRRTMATGMGELGVQPHIIEAAINHQSGHKAGVAGTYNRANYHAERKVALERWADHVMALVTKRPFVVVAKAA